MDGVDRGALPKNITESRGVGHAMREGPEEMRDQRQRGGAGVATERSGRKHHEGARFMLACGRLHHCNRRLTRNKAALGDV